MKWRGQLEVEIGIVYMEIAIEFDQLKKHYKLQATEEALQIES